jgi:hypothetical protein
MKKKGFFALEIYGVFGKQDAKSENYAKLVIYI